MEFIPIKTLSIMEEKVSRDVQESSKGNGKTPPAEKPKTIRHFTSVENLCLILKNGLRMGDAKNWEDKNDSYGIQRYAELQNGKKVLVLCFCATPGNVHHWTSLKTQKGLMCAIDIRKDDFFNYVKTLGGFQEPKSVIYCKNKNVLDQSRENLPYLKRSEYHIEREIRILYVGHSNTEKDVYIPNIKEFIEHVIIEMSNEELYNLAKETLVDKKYGIEKSKIRGEGFLDSKVWKQNIDTLIANSK